MKEGLYSFGKRNILTYSNTVNLDRSVPELYDGLKTVQRRILWAAGTVCPSNGHFIKSARIVGEVLGKFHPHSGDAIYDAMVNMSQSHTDIGYVEGSGNWGTLVDGAAASRYTEAKLSNYGEDFLKKEYIAVTNFVPNYDDSLKEPVVLPALLPNVILNGNSGIGVGITTNLPSFTLPSVKSVLKRLLNGEELSEKDFAKELKPNQKFGGSFVNTKENRHAYLEMFKGSSASVQFQSDLKVDETKRQIIVDTWPSGLTPENLVSKLQGHELCGSIYNSKGTLEYTVIPKKNSTREDFNKLVKVVERSTTVKSNYKINVTHRTAKTEDGVTTFDTKFFSLSIPQLLIQWLRLRVKLEIKCLKHKVKVKLKDIEATELLRYGITILDILTSAVKQKKVHPVQYVVKHTKLNEEQANYLLHRQLIQLSKLEDESLAETLKQQNKDLKTLQYLLKNPKESVINSL